MVKSAYSRQPVELMQRIPSDVSLEHVACVHVCECKASRVRAGAVLITVK